MSKKAIIALEEYKRLRNAADEAWGKYLEALDIAPKTPRQRQDRQSILMQEMEAHHVLHQQGKRKKVS